MITVSNHDLGRAFGLYAELLQLHGKDERLSDWLSGAAYRIRQMEEQVGSLSEDELKSVFRPEIINIINEAKEKGNIEALDELVQLTPAGLFDMMRIKGLGGRKLHVLWKTAKIDDVEELLQAAKEGRIRKIAGFGAKTEQNIIAAIEALNSNAQSFHYASVASLAAQLEKALQELFGTGLFSLCGDIRRQTTTIDTIELITSVPADLFTTQKVKRLIIIDEQTSTETSGHTVDEVPVTIYHCRANDFYAELFQRTGNAGHVGKVLQRTKALENPESEESIYKNARLPFIPPEMREDIAEWDWAKHPVDLISDADIRGVVHNHTTWSDGVDALEPFVQACKRKGYEYVVISDHSQNAHYAGGLKPDKVLRQLEAIDQLNRKKPGINVFKSIECDILVSGELDYDPELLARFDMVIISVHQQLKMAEQKATARLIKAIENPFTTILGHMTGRQLLVRPGYPVNFKKVIDACAANGVVIEINANPYRLDMDWSHIPYALEKGVMISINPDSHSIHEIDNIHWGVAAARKGGLTKAMTWNALPAKDIIQWIRKKH